MAVDFAGVVLLVMEGQAQVAFMVLFTMVVVKVVHIVQKPVVVVVVQGQEDPLAALTSEDADWFELDWLVWLVSVRRRELLVTLR